MALLVTGSAGFIGSNLVEHLLSMGHTVIGVDNMSTGRQSNVEGFDSDRFTQIELDLYKTSVGDIVNTLGSVQFDACFHLAANADVRGGVSNSHIDFEQNITVTHKVCEVSKQLGIGKLLFSSTAAAYGEPPENEFPTKESYHPTQTSHYGASKMAAESIIEGYSAYGYFTSSVFRFVSWIGPRYSHGVIYDFVKKLRKDPNKLEVLGNGSQEKSYLHVADGVAGMYKVFNEQKTRHGVYNVGNDYVINVLDLARIVIDEMGISGTMLDCQSDEPRGWVGDSPLVILDTVKLRALGWKPQISIEEGIRDTVNYLCRDTNLFR